MTTRWTRREWMLRAPAAAGLGLAASAGVAPARTDDARDPFLYGLNTSTLRGHNLTLRREAEIAAEAGYGGLEPWIRELDAHVEAGGSLADLGKRLADLGLSVESAIGFFEWAVDDDDRRKKALEQARRDMEKVKAIGGKRIAAPPVGMTDRSDADLRRIAGRYRELLELGDAIGVVPEAEVWGFSKTLGRLGEAALVAIEAGHPDACILPDVYHLYKGGSEFGGLHLLRGEAIPVMHMNDYPAAPPRAEITDAHRVYPGDGVAPLGDILRTLHAIGFRGMLSLELFNKEYWAQDPATVARTGLEKMKAAVRAALG